MEFFPTCRLHQKKAYNFCFAEECENPLMCISCLLSHDKNHETKYIDYSDLKDEKPIENLKKQFDSLCFNAQDMKNYQLLLEKIDQAQVACLSIFKDLRNEVGKLMDIVNIDVRKTILTEIEEDYKKRIKTSQSFSEEDLKKIIKKINDFSINMNKISIDNIFENNLEIIKKELWEVESFLLTRKNEIVNKIKLGSILIKFDRIIKSPFISLSENDLLATMKKNNENHVVFFENCYSKGIIQWKLELKGIKESNGDWIQFGVLDKEEFGSSNDYNKYIYPNNKNSWSIASSNYFNKYSFRMNVTGKTQSYKNLIFVCTLDCDKSIFTIEGNGIKAEANGIGKKCLYPFVGFWNLGATVKIIP